MPRTRPQAATVSAEDPPAADDRRRATSYDVAQLAGVSQSAVSRSFKPGASVSKATRDRVMDAARALAYQPNAIARGLITRRSNLIAVLLSGRVNLYYPELLFKLTEQLAAKDLRVLLFAVDSAEDSERMLRQVSQYQVDGAISATNLTAADYAQIEERRIPFVLFNRWPKDYPANVVYCDPAHQVEELLGRLTDLGHRRFGLVHGPDANAVSRERMRIVQASLETLGMAPPAVAGGDFSYETGGEALRQLMQGRHPPTAVICVNDMMALGAVDEARKRMGLDIPGQLSIAGFDGIGASRFASYELTTIRQPIGRMASAAVDMLLARIEQPSQSAERRVFEGAIIDGLTVGPAPLSA